MNVYFTVDTESSIGGAFRFPNRSPVSASRHVFCRIGQKDFGIPLLVRILGNFGYTGTFFVETLATRCLGEADTKCVLEFLLNEGQDAQLHVHPVYRFYSKWREARHNNSEYELPKYPDRLGHFDKAQQMDLLGEAIRYFERLAGYRPAAFRAGGYAGSSVMMSCLSQFGIALDSSFNPCFHPLISFPGSSLEPNVVQKINGVWEVPITVARTRLPEGYNRFKFGDCSSLSIAEIRTMLDSAEALGQEHFVMVFHSFSTVKAKDETYELLRPNRIVIRRLERLFRYLAENRQRFSVETLGKLAADMQSFREGRQEKIIVELPLLNSVIRKATQAINNVYWI